MKQDNNIKLIPNFDCIGVYTLTNDINGKMYVGGSKNVHNRIKQHEISFRNRKCPLAFLGDLEQGHTFSARVIEIMPEGTTRFKLSEREAYFTELYDTLNNGYNTAPTVVCTKEDLIASLGESIDNEKTMRYLVGILSKNLEPMYSSNKHEKTA